jgi:tetratricopeptide (TPR) repeat protein
VVWQIRLAASVGPWSGLDTTAYVELAQRVQAGDWGLGPGLYYVSPFYIYFLAVALFVTKSFTAVRLIQAGLGTVGIGFMYLTAREWFSERAAWIAALLAGCTGLFAFYESLILQTSVDVFLTAAGLFCLTYALRTSGPNAERWTGHWTFWTGVVFGLQTLNRPQIAIAVFFLVLLCAALRRWRFAALLTAGLLIGIAPSAIRNAVVSRQFSVLSSQGGLNFYIGNGEGATGFYRFIPGITPTIKGQANDTRHVASIALGREVGDAEASTYFTNLALSWMAAHPAGAALLLVRKFGWTFHAQHVPLPYSYPFYQYDFPTWLRFMVVGPWLLVPLGLVGLIFARGSGSLVPGAKFDAPYLIFVSFVPAYAIAVALFLISERYRLPLLVPLAIGAGAAIDLVIRLAQRKAWRSLSAPIAIASVLFVAVNTRAMANDGRWEEGLRMAAQLALEGRYDESDAWVARLEAKTSHPGDASGSIGLQLLMKNEAARALPHLQKAAALDPNKPAIEYALGQALLGVGKVNEAIPYLQRGFDQGASLPLAGYHLAAALKDVGRTADAIAILPKIKMTDESSVHDWLTVGRLGMELRAPDQAAPYFQRAVALAPANADARLQFGVNLVVLKRFADAARELSEAVRLDPTSAPGFAYLAYSEQQLGRIDDARRHLGAALALDPHDPMAHSLAGTIR